MVTIYEWVMRTECHWIGIAVFVYFIVAYADNNFPGKRFIKRYKRLSEIFRIGCLIFALCGICLTLLKYMLITSGVPII